MNLKCSNCGGVIVLNPETGTMECTQCKSVINVSFSEKKRDLDVSDSIIDEDVALEFAKRDRAEKYLKESKRYVSVSADNGVGINEDEFEQYIADLDKTDTLERTISDSNINYMNINIYNCTSCGAKLMINDKESASFCAYCGQPTIIFERVSKELQPDIIIPFKITKEKAVELIKEKLKKGLFVPSEVKKFEIDKLRGIYIPYWLFSVNSRCKMNMVIEETKKGKNDRESKVVSYPAYKDMECEYRIPADASRRLNDNISVRLEPYDMSQAVDFDMGYLSGFYADRYDVPADEIKEKVERRSQKFVEKSILDNFNILGTVIIKSKENKNIITDIEYAMLPAWFITFRYKGGLYTILVNGQTGKVVGNVPVEKFRAISAVCIFATVVTICTTFASVYLGNDIYKYLICGDTSAEAEMGSTSLGFLALLFIISLSVCANGILKMKKHIRDIGTLGGGVMTRFVRKRQDKTWVR